MSLTGRDNLLFDAYEAPDKLPRLLQCTIDDYALYLVMTSLPLSRLNEQFQDEHALANLLAGIRPQHLFNIVVVIK